MARTIAELLELTKAGLVDEATKLGIEVKGSTTKAKLANAIRATELAQAKAAKAAKVAPPEETAPPAPPTPPPTAPASPVAPRADAQRAQRVQDLLGDIRSAHKAGAKANIFESDESLQREVEALLTEDERRRVVWGSSGTQRIVG